MFLQNIESVKQGTISIIYNSSNVKKQRKTRKVKKFLFLNFLKKWLGSNFYFEGQTITITIETFPTMSPIIYLCMIKVKEI